MASSDDANARPSAVPTPSAPPAAPPRISPEQELATAKKALETGDTALAAKHVAFALSADPVSPAVRAMVDELYTAVPDPLTLAPLEQNTQYGVVVLRAAFLHKQGKLPQALELLVQVMAIRPDVPFGAWLSEWLDDATLATLDPTLTARIFDLCLQRLLQTELGLLHGRVVAEKIAEVAQRARAVHPSVGALAFTVSRALRMSRKADEAFKVAKEEHDARPTYLSAVFLAGAYRELGKLAEAHQCFEEALAKQPDDVGVHLDLGDLSLDLGRPDDAIKQYEWVLAREPQNEWALPSLAYAKFVKTGDKTARTALEEFADKDTKGRARALAFAITPFLGFLPRRPESILGAVDAIREQIKQKGIDELKKGPIKLQISSLEAPSAIRAAAAQIGELGLTVDIEFREIPQPDPRLPAQKTVYELFQYDGAATKPVLPPATEKTALAIARLAASRFHGPSWAELARRTAKELGFDKVPEILSTMVIPPPVPRTVLPDGKPGPVPFKVADWWFRVQVAAALTVAFIDEGWDDSVRKRALESMVFGPPDWITTAGMIALTALANVDPVARPHAEALLYGLIRPASSPIEMLCVAQPLAHCLLQLPGLDDATRKSFRDLRAEMER